VLRSLLPAYVALCDAKAIQCEETMLAIPKAETDACLPLYQANGTCSPQCAALAGQLSSNKCFESVWSVQEAIAYAANQSCGDSAAFVSRTSKSSEWRRQVYGLNLKCNPSVPFPVELPDAQRVLDAAWSASRVFNQTAGDPHEW